MATLEDLLVQSNQSSPIQPLRSTTLSETYGQDSTSNPEDGTYEWDTPDAIYDFGKMRLGQQQNELRAAGPSPVMDAVWKKDIRSSGGSGGQVFRDYSDETFAYQQRLVEARKRLAKQQQDQQNRLLQERESSLASRIQYQYPITDIV